MSMYDVVTSDLDEVVFADEWFVEHLVNEKKMLALVHSGYLNGQQSEVSLGVMQSQVALIVRRSDFGNELPAVGALINLDGKVWQIRGAQYLGYALIKMNLEENEA